ncbi:hypothetical protein IAR55_003506 [Kwoniella newhampshirensis]|uniref:RING-type E3 ubiquitin transferase n=1 Tax=Kwoniella newhampshirensis TaxID=1651941 RepID=A0AAW0YYS4_9TREE
MPDTAPFWLCHECGAQMRPVTVNDVPHCASCNGEFIEILDPEVNPDPFHDLPPPPPTRPGQQTSSAPSSARSSASPGPGPGEGGTSFFSNLFGNLLGAAATNQGQEGHDGQMTGGEGEPSGSRRSSPNRNQGPGGPRTFTFNFPGGGRGQVMFGGFGGNLGSGGMGAFGPAGTAGENPFESFFPPGIAPPRRARNQQGQPLGGPGDSLDGAELLRALFTVLGEEGQMPPHMMFGGPAGRATMGDYATSEQGFNDILETLMQAAGPQGPLPATDVVIEGLPRFKFDEKTLAQSTYKDCPICKDDFVVGDEVMRIPCSHIFHPDCLQPWLKVNGSCPVCRFSLVPENDDRQRQPRPSNTPGQPQTPAQTGSGGGPASAVTSILNRLFGQSGTTSNPTSPGVTEPAQTPFGSIPEQVSVGTSSSSQAQSQMQSQSTSAPTQDSSEQNASVVHNTDALPISGQAANPVQPPMSTVIPEDYRARHRERERQRHTEEENSGVDHFDLD